MRLTEHSGSVSTQVPCLNDQSASNSSSAWKFSPYRGRVDRVRIAWLAIPAGLGTFLLHQPIIGSDVAQVRLALSRLDGQRRRIERYHLKPRSHTTFVVGKIVDAGALCPILSCKWSVSRYDIAQRMKKRSRLTICGNARGDWARIGFVAAESLLRAAKKYNERARVLILYKETGRG